MTGLLSQKPNSPIPTCGSRKEFVWQERIGKSGKPWIKIKNAQDGEGQLCEILSVAKTDYIDSHGNISFNIEFNPLGDGGGDTGSEHSTSNPARHRPAAGAHDADRRDPAASNSHANSKDDYWERKLQHEISVQPKIIRQHSQSMALEVLKLKVTLNELKVEDLTPAKLTSLANYFDNDVLGAAQ